MGEIEDEWDTEENALPIEAVDGGWRANGQLPVSVLNDTIGTQIDSVRNVETLGGFIMEQLGRLPTPGDHCSHADFEFTIAEMDGRRIRTVMIATASVEDTDVEDD